MPFIARRKYSTNTTTWVNVAIHEDDVLVAYSLKWFILTINDNLVLFGKWVGNRDAKVNKPNCVTKLFGTIRVISLHFNKLFGSIGVQTYTVKHLALFS